MATPVRSGLALVLALLCGACSVTGQEGSGVVRRSAPPNIRQDSATGTAVVRVTTDAHGKIVAAVIVKSTGGDALDRAAVEDTKDQWHGAVSSTEDVMVKYTPGPNGSSAPTFGL